MFYNELDALFKRVKSVWMSRHFVGGFKSVEIGPTWFLTDYRDQGMTLLALPWGNSPTRKAYLSLMDQHILWEKVFYMSIGYKTILNWLLSFI